MKTKELMIGDLVYDTEKKKYGRVDKLEHDVEDDTVEPIPLTAEILKKNGFELDEEASNDFGFECYAFPLGKGFYIEHHNEYRITDHQLMEFKYVHELQHVLRLCKIDKEIEL